MASVTFLPSRDDALLAWSAHFRDLIVATPTAFGLTSTLATAYGVLHDAFADALLAADPAIRNKPATAAKNAAKLALKNDARLLASLVNGTASVTDAQKLELGLTVRAAPSPIPPPSGRPTIEIVSVIGRTVRIRLKDGEATRRGRPPGVQGASVFSHVGPSAPDDITTWVFEGSTSKVSVDITFPDTAAPGALVWITAFWFNPRAQSGAAAIPISVNIGGGLSMAA